MLGLVILTQKHDGLFLGPGKSKEATMLSVFALDRAVSICAKEFGISTEEAKAFIQRDYIDKWVGNMH